MDDSELFDGLGLLLPLTPTPATPPSTPPPAPPTPEWLFTLPPQPTALQVRLDGELADDKPAHAKPAHSKPAHDKPADNKSPDEKPPVANISLPPASRIEKKTPRPRPQSKKLLSPIKPLPKHPRSPSSKTEPISLKEKREKEARLFPKEVLSNLDGTTSAEVRKMNSAERELVLFKRKLRNRESARRSRQKRQAALADLQEQIDDLMQFSARMVDIGLSLKQDNNSLRDRLALALSEIKSLKGRLETTEPAADAAMKMKLGG